MNLEPSIDCINRGQHFLVTCHRIPDADALGSSLGLAALLRQLNKKVTLYIPDTLADSLLFLPGLEHITQSLPKKSRFDATFVMDLAAETLLPINFPSSKRSGPRIVFDHHASHDSFGDIVVRDIHAAATAEVVVQLARRMLNTKTLSREMAMPLYAALVGDTGGFRYSTKPATLRLGAELLEAGFDAWQVAYQLFEDWPHARMALLQRLLGSLKLICNGRAVLMHVTQTMLAETGADELMVEGLVNYGRMLRGVEIAALAWEHTVHSPSPSRLAIKVSLRSRDNANAAIIAEKMGGGGHRNAAGALVDDSLANVLVLLEQHILSSLA